MVKNGTGLSIVVFVQHDEVRVLELQRVGGLLGPARALAGQVGNAGLGLVPQPDHVGLIPEFMIADEGIPHVIRAKIPVNGGPYGAGRVTVAGEDDECPGAKSPQLQSEAAMIKAIREAGCTPVQRNTFYEPINVWDGPAPLASPDGETGRSGVLEGNLATA